MLKSINLLSVIFITFLVSNIFAQSNQYSEIASMPGAFARMGFGARGMGMGNAMSSVITGDKVAYYNPALSVYQENNSFQTSYSFLSQDRNLNFVSFTRKFEFGKRDSDGKFIEKPRVAGLSAGIINASVSNFPARDNQGNVTGELNPYENQFFVSLANQFTDKLTIGFTAKFYYSKLYDQISTNTFGIDIGALYKVNEKISISAVVSDLLSKYEWDTTPIYGMEGFSIDDKFPMLRKIGVSYFLEQQNLIAALELENTSAGNNYLRFGVEYGIYEGLFLRGGLDKFDLSNTSVPSRPSLGFSYFYDIVNLDIGFNYAFVVEPYSSFDQHIIGIDINF
ncbi:MAG: hypothetical protein KKF62_08835 [Bacteroidetes bacterium]|nr:hypothetical protein [Bacteroidota bacterium]MBU1115817.1 hypothetical protein [Bacteroidota bacterium]MBU1800210.1 hypothetical protein [Bacteroidota bacterium]